MLRAWWAAVIACLIAFAFPADAGQVRINVDSNFFDNDTTFLNQGDHAVFVWISGSHTVTSGTVSGSTLLPDGLFASGPQQGTFSNGGTAFTWKSTATGNRNYYCQPHALIGMRGILRIQASGVAVADFRITEVQYGAAGNLDRIEIMNMGDAAGDLGRYRISISATASDVDILPVSVPVPAGGRVTIHTNEVGTHTATDIFMGAGSLGIGGSIGNLPDVNGSVTLYAPYRQSSTTPGLMNTNTIIDFVQWGADGQPNVDVAETAALWPNGDVVSGAQGTNYSISFCGNKTQHGASFWNVTLANFGTAGLCTTPSLNTSWGRLKTLYR